jgi:hypothetical protein
MPPRPVPVNLWKPSPWARLPLCLRLPVALSAVLVCARFSKSGWICQIVCVSPAMRRILH